MESVVTAHRNERAQAMTLAHQLSSFHCIQYQVPLLRLFVRIGYFSSFRRAGLTFNTYDSA